MIIACSPSSKINQLPSDDDFGRVSSMASVGPNQTPTSLMSTNPNVVSSRQTISSKDDASIASSGSLTKKKTPITGSRSRCDSRRMSHKHSILLDHQTNDVDPQSIVSSIITDSGISETSETPLTTIFDRPSSMQPISSSQSLSAQQQPNAEMGHSRNSSNTSQVCIPSSMLFKKRF